MDLLQEGVKGLYGINIVPTDLLQEGVNFVFPGRRKGEGGI
jgi:hypothetical protein